MGEGLFLPTKPTPYYSSYINGDFWGWEMSQKELYPLGRDYEMRRHKWRSKQKPEPAITEELLERVNHLSEARKIGLKDWEFEEGLKVIAEGFGFPSGHALNIALCCCNRAPWPWREEFQVRGVPVLRNPYSGEITPRDPYDVD